MIDADRLSAEFGLGAVLGLDPLAGGGADVARLRTITGDYVVKPVYREWEPELYSTVEQALNARGIRQARLFRNRSGGVVSASGHSVQEFLDGTITTDPDPRQRHAFFVELARYDSVLAEIPVPPDLVVEENLFTRVTSVPYLVENLPGLMERHAPHLDAAPVRSGLLRLAGASTELSGLAAQIVHGDHGPDNVLYSGSDVVAIIDFSPHFQPALFGLATGLYWFCVYRRLDLPGIEESLAAYGAHRELSVDELAAWPAMLLREGLRRLATPLAVQEELGQPAAPDRLQARYAALLSLIDNLPA